jgi:hypothetical protein
MLHRSLLTASKVVSGSVSTRDLTRFSAADCHQAILYLVQTGAKERELFDSISH